jgi:hypothetical protein
VIHADDSIRDDAQAVDDRRERVARLESLARVTNLATARAAMSAAQIERELRARR